MYNGRFFHNVNEDYLHYVQGGESGRRFRCGRTASWPHGQPQGQLGWRPRSLGL